MILSTPQARLELEEEAQKGEKRNAEAAEEGKERKEHTRREEREREAEVPKEGARTRKEQEAHDKRELRAREEEQVNESKEEEQEREQPWLKAETAARETRGQREAAIAVDERVGRARTTEPIEHIARRVTGHASPPFSQFSVLSFQLHY